MRVSGHHNASTIPKSGNVLPNTPTDNGLSVHWFNSKPVCYLFLCASTCFRHFSYFFHDFTRKKGKPLTFPNGSISKSFNNCILDVFLACSQEKVVRIAAFFVIAFVANLHFFWNQPIYQTPRKTMGGDLYPINPKICVPVWPCVVFPIPTLVISPSTNMKPESFFMGHGPVLPAIICSVFSGFLWCHNYHDADYFLRLQAV